MGRPCPIKPAAASGVPPSLFLLERLSFRRLDSHGVIVGGVAGHMAGHGKSGAAPGWAIGHHEANKQNPNNSNAQAPAPQK
jgi:hypothetical protein